MRLATQLRLALAIALAVASVTSLAVWRASQRAAIAADQLADTQDVALEVGSMIALTLEQTAFALAHSAEQWEARHRQLMATLAAATPRTGSREALQELTRQAQDLREIFLALTTPAPADARASTPSIEARRRELLIERLVVASQDIVQLRWRWAEEVSRQQRAIERELMAITVVALALNGMIIGALIVLVLRRVMAPLEQLRAGAEAIRRGDLAARCQVQVDNELGDVAQGVDAMAQALQREGHALAEVNRDLGNEVRRRTQSEQQMQLITDQVPLQIAYIDRERRYRFVNEALRGYFGVPIDRIVGRRFEEIVGYPLSAAVSSRLDAALAGEPQQCEEPGVRNPGRVFDVHMMPDRDAEGEVRGVVATVADVTELRADERSLRDALAERETLLREVYHRVKNNLQVVQSLLNLQRRALPGGAARAAFDDTIQRVRAMALVHEKLYQSGNLARVSLTDYLGDLLDHLTEAASAASRGVTVVVDALPVELPLDAAVPFGLLVTELVGNSLKHGFPDGRRGSVAVSLGWVDGHARLRVSDDGVGLPAGFALPVVRSMGLQLAQSLTMQLGGTLVAERGEHGAAFEAGLTRLDAMMPTSGDAVSLP